ncbi:hypothetical protein COY07_02540 [Candidatus Peregrinibacteria bacterium CG_4_10_14_0_2_um_filter_43_11]|nr:MAG: hypothetical protein COY07_02540 [Candidatus Peregrinibacteria bacterium CG_4_10_14_0_2_um_filter_43_11]
MLEAEKKYYINKVLCASDPDDPRHFLNYRFRHVFLVFGFTGSGKDTVINTFLKENKEHPFVKFVRTMTRDQRPDELEMTDGFFVEKKLFDTLKKNHRFFYDYERYNGTQFGYDAMHFIFQLVHRNIIMAGGGEANFEGLIEGIHNIIDMIPVTTIFINRPKEDIIASLKKRGGDPAQIQGRIDNINAQWYEKPKKQVDHFILNTDLKASVAEFVRIIDATLATKIGEEDQLMPRS